MMRQNYEVARQSFDSGLCASPNSFYVYYDGSIMTISTISEAFEIVKEAVDKADNQAFLVESNLEYEQSSEKRYHALNIIKNRLNI